MNTWIWIAVVAGATTAGIGIGVYLALRPFRKMNW